MYAAHGSNASWAWLETIAPCIDILRQLANQLNRDIGSYQGTSHRAADLMKDIDILMESLQKYGVYNMTLGRVLDEDDAPAVDVISKGLELLTHGASSPLKDFNEAFKTLQRRRKVPPLPTYTDGVAVVTPVQTNAAAVVNMPMVEPLTSAVGPDGQGDSQTVTGRENVSCGAEEDGEEVGELYEPTCGIEDEMDVDLCPDDEVGESSEESSGEEDDNSEEDEDE